MNRQTRQRYDSFKPQHALQLAAPHTWAAAITPVVLSVAISIASIGSVSGIMTIVLFLICVLMQSAVNTFNDYYDYVKGTDDEDNSSADEFDATLVYNHLNPRTVLFVAITFLVAAFALGVYVVLQVGLFPLVIGLIGAVFVVIYSAGKTPISYYPLGEAVSGIVMGGLITIACCYSLTGSFDPLVILLSFPLIIGIGLIMFTNNTCDIEKDIQAKRRTLPVVIGYERSVSAYHLSVIVWIALIIALVAIFYPGGILITLIMVAAAFPLLRGLFKNPYKPQTRDGAMQLITLSNLVLNVFYALAIALSTAGGIWF